MLFSKTKSSRVKKISRVEADKENQPEQIINGDHDHDPTTIDPWSILPRPFNCCQRIDEVMPHLFPKYLDFADILECADISDEWKDAVSSLLENHSDRRPYTCLEKNALSETHFNYFPLPRMETRGNCLLTNEDTSIEPVGSPFLGGVVNVALFPPNYFSEPRNRTEEIGRLTKIWKRLTTHRHHIRHLSFIFHSYVTTVGHLSHFVVTPILQVLKTLPHLKSFKLTGDHQLSNLKEVDEDPDQDLELIPIPAKVESLVLPENTWGGHIYSKKIHTVLLQSFANHTQIKMLSVDIANWEAKYEALFPNLTELHLTSGLTFTLDQISNVFNNFNFPCLRKLRVSCKQLKIRRLLRLLSPLEIESLELFITEDMECQDGDDLIIPSVTTLKLVITPKTTLRFLKYFPNMEYLTVFISPWGDWQDIDFLPKVQKLGVFGMSLRRFVLENRTHPKTFRCVWTEFRKLKMLTIHNSPAKNDVARQYLVGSKDKVYTSFSCTPTAMESDFWWHSRSVCS